MRFKSTSLGTSGNTMNRFTYSLLIICAWLVPAIASAADRYVRQDATGRNDGSDWANAYTSLPQALIRGDTYYVADGAYAGRTFSTPASGTTLITIKKATPADHGTSSGWIDAHGDGQATFSGQFRFTTGYWLVDGATGGGAENSWVGKFGFKITESASTILLIDNASARNVTVRHIDMVGKGRATLGSDPDFNRGIAVWGAPNVTLSYYRMTGIGSAPFMLSASNFVAEHGWVVSFFGDASAHSELASIWNFAGGLGDTTFRYNLITDIQSTGGLMWDNSSNNGAQLMVYGNVFYKPAGASWDRANGLIGGWTGGNGEQFRNAKVYNNTFINVDQQTLSTFPNIYSGNVAYNNIFYNCSSPDFAKFGVHDNNIFINSGG
jgi:hypothetical protein